ncbi:TMEM175 family protein [Gordonia sp. VNK21]|uniref:TMEM175 family protein n=1 Tax=Gordonia sp. VNK21 TaxID=3382483 RepID=UPI0038D3E87B
MSSVDPAPPPAHGGERFAYDSNEFGRGITFFDAIYAFSATLLITNLDAPAEEDWRSVSALLDSGLGAQLLGFTISFVVITLFWRVNVGILRQLSALNRPVIIANLVAAGLVILIPFTTSGISIDDVGDYPLPTALYALNIALASLAQTAIYLTAHHHRVLADGADRLPAHLLASLVPPAVFLMSIPIAYAAGPAAGQWTWLSLVVLVPLSGRLLGPTRSS